ncbi:Lrp/AsnC family transcriptional regulator [Agrobacterium sp. NPDC089420]|uniref:Lrp/AsnC family transcriptional regulator n=1 Tax=Agrobacterium sp. NPDC089420 TaxID=3363918 RepID=UPI00384C5BD3
MDTFDHRLLDELRKNARISNVDLGRRIGLSASACARRIRELENSGVIRAYTVVVNKTVEKIGKPVFIQVKLASPSRDAMRRFEEAVRHCEEIRECFLITGASDYILRVEVDGLDEFERIHSEVLSHLPGVSSVLSSFTIRSAFSYETAPGKFRSQKTRVLPQI